MELINTLFGQTILLKDRFFNESFELPYSFDDIKIQSNDLATFRVINDAVDKLQYNFLYLYGLTEMGSNAIPTSLSGVAGVALSSTDVQWFSNTINLTGFTGFANAGLSGLDRAVVTHTAYSDVYGSMLLFSCAVDSITIVKVDEANSIFTPVLSTTTVTTNSDLAFVDIKAAVVANKYLFVLDAHYNNLYRYDISGILTEDVFPKQLVLSKTIGGFGTFQDRYKFNAPTSCCVANDRIYVLDAGNFSVKVYDINLNFVESHHLKDLFIDNRPLGIIIDAHENTPAIFTENKVVYTFSIDFQVREAANLSRLLGDGATFCNMFTPKTFDNCYYIVMSDNIYKFFASKPRNSIGTFSLYRFGYNVDENTYIYASSVPNRLNTEDIIYITVQDSVSKKILRAQDTANFVSVLTYSDFAVYTAEEIHAKASEYMQTWVINKIIAKLLLNHLRLKDRLRGRFTGKYDVQNNPVFAGTLYFLLDDLDLTAYKPTLDHFVGSNEVLTNTSINRGLQKIYDIQRSIIEKSNTIVQDSSFFQNQTVNLV